MRPTSQAQSTSHPWGREPRSLREPLPPALGSLTRERVRAYFDASWQLNERLFSAITEEATYYTRPDPLRQPLVFYLGHTAAFYVNKLRLAGLLARPLDTRLDELLARGVDPVSSDELNGCVEWPALEAVWTYRESARALVCASINALDWSTPVTEADPRWAILMGIEHARIHFETSSVLVRQCPVDELRRPRGWTYAESTPAPAARFVQVAAGPTVVGRPRGGRLFGWDNEFGRDLRRVDAFETSAHFVTNADYRAFVDAGGYHDASFWNPEGWRWRVAHHVTAPRFWERGPAGALRYRAMFDELDLPESWPVEVNAHEAEAYCRWHGGVRLPTEAEWSRMVDVTPGARADEEGASFHLHCALGSPRPVDAAAVSDAAGERVIHDVRGNVWQWLSDDFHPLPGFRPHGLYEDFSAPYFGAEHATLRGGSWATTGAGASVHYRLWFRRNFYQHAGFRLVRVA